MKNKNRIENKEKITDVWMKLLEGVNWNNENLNVYVSLNLRSHLRLLEISFTLLLLCPYFRLMFRFLFSISIVKNTISPTI